MPTLTRKPSRTPAHSPESCVRGTWLNAAWQIVPSMQTSNTCFDHGSRGAHLALRNSSDDNFPMPTRARVHQADG